MSFSSNTKRNMGITKTQLADTLKPDSEILSGQVTENFNKVQGGLYGSAVKEGNRSAYISKPRQHRQDIQSRVDNLGNYSIRGKQEVYGTSMQHIVGKTDRFEKYDPNKMKWGR